MTGDRCWVLGALFVLSVLLVPWARADVLFAEDFERGLDRWKITATTGKTVSEAGNGFLRLGNGDALADSLMLPAEFVLTARVRILSGTKWPEAPIKFHIQPDGNFVQVYLEGRGQQVAAVASRSKEWYRIAFAPASIPLDEWHALRIVCSGGMMGVQVDGKPVLTVKDPLPKPGGLGLRLADGLTDYDDITVTSLTDADREMKEFANLPGRPLTPIKTRWQARYGGGTMTIEHDDLAFPLQPLSVKFAGAEAPPSVVVVSSDGKRQPPRKMASAASGQVELNGPLGEYTLVWSVSGREVARTKVRLAAESGFESDNPADARFFTLLKEIVQGDELTIREGERAVRTNPSWVRDHIHEMKAYRWWENDLTSFVDRLIELQPERGFFHEIITGLGDSHLTFVKPEFVYRNEQDKVGFVRLEQEADVEYLMAEAVHTIWKATGDNEAMAKRLPAIERGLKYNLEDPTRWDPRHKLLMRPFTVDTWDFTWGVSTSNRGIDPDMPMCIMHGDNSGLYAACLQVAEMRAALGDTEAAKKWRETAEGIRERANRLLWNGRFYTHEYHLQPVDVGCDESNMLSLSNTYDINRGMPTHEMAVKIIDEYRARRKSNPNDVAEWYALDPPYPNFVLYKAGEYINGGIAGFVAGELAKAAFRHGREEYGADILKRVRELSEKTGTVYFLMTRDGKDIGMGPRGWAAAAVMSAQMEGLAGIADQGVLFEKIELAPRYPSAGINSARACLKYGPSDAYVATDYTHDTKSRTITIGLAGSPEKVDFHILMPSGAAPASVRVNGRAVKSATRSVEQGRYCDFSITRTAASATQVVVTY